MHRKEGKGNTKPWCRKEKQMKRNLIRAASYAVASIKAHLLSCEKVSLNFYACFVMKITAEVLALCCTKPFHLVFLPRLR